jgi:probable HAF family extracellular repeat protein
LLYRLWTDILELTINNENLGGGGWTMKRQLILVAGFLTAVLFSGTAVFADVSFQGLGDLPGGFFYSKAHAISSDGSMVVGRGRTDSSWEAFRWTVSDGMVGLGDIPDGASGSGAYGTSADGSVTVGYGLSASGHEASHWTASDGMVGLGDLPGGPFFSWASAVSADGSVVVGRSNSTSGMEAFRWTAEDGMIGLGDLPGLGFFSEAKGVSADGSVVVGFSNSAYTEAFRWTAGSGMVGLGDLADGEFGGSHANAVSADGSVIVGYGTLASGKKAVRWNASGDIFDLGDLPGGNFSSNANAVSADGAVVVGYGSTDSGWEASLWTAHLGMISVQDILEVEYDLDLTGWTLVEATGISGDGSTLVGYGYNPDGNREAWLATIPAPSADAGGPYFMDIGNPPITLAGSVAGEYTEAAWDLDLDGLFDDAFGLNPLISSDMLTSWGFSPGMTWDIGLRVTGLYGGVDTSTTQLTFVPIPSAVLLGFFGLAFAGFKLRKQ